jgi:hypothetical protein
MKERANWRWVPCQAGTCAGSCNPTLAQCAPRNVGIFVDYRHVPGIRAIPSLLRTVEVTALVAEVGKGFLKRGVGCIAKG